jgi:glycosyltransferase involved in cell wall biosynthesis
LSPLLLSHKERELLVSRPTGGGGYTGPAMTSLRPEISVVIPVYNEVENAPDLHRELTLALEPMGRPYEIIVVDDGSTDGTFARLQEIEASDPRLRVLRLRRNFGQTAAFSAGFDHALGDIVITSDGDLQNDPADIPMLVAKLEEGYDLVCGWRVARQDTLSRRLPSIVANRLISWATGVHLHDYGCSLKAMRIEVVKGIKLYGEMHRFIPAVASWMGVTLAEVRVNHRARTRGQSKYGIGRTLRVLLDLFTVKFLLNYGTRPAHLFGFMGLTSAGAGGLILAYLAWVKLFLDEAIGGRPLLFLGGLLFLTGVILVNFGLVGELLVRTYHESQGKPIYVIKEIRAQTKLEQRREPALRN